MSSNTPKRIIYKYPTPLFSGKISTQFNYFPFLLILLPYCLLAQIDSLKQVLPTLAEDTNKVNTLNELSYAYHNNDIQQTFIYGNEALNLANQLNYSKGKAAAYHNLCIANSISGKLEIALQFNDQVIALADSLKAFSLLIDAYKAKGILQDKAGNPEVAIQYHQKAFDLAVKENYPSGIIDACFNLGGAYAELDNFQKARAYYEQAVTTGASINDQASISWGYRSIANNYHAEKNYAEATIYYEKALTIARTVGRKRSLAFALSDYAQNLLKQGKREMAEQYFLESIQIIQTTGDNRGAVIALRDLGRFYLDTDHPNKAIQAFEQALATNKWPNTPLETGILNLLSKGYAQKEAFQKAYEIQQLFNAKSDSIDYQSKLKLTAELEEKYQSKKKEAENALLRAGQQQQIAIIEEQKAFNFYLVTIASLLALLGVTAFQAYRNKQRNNLLLEEKVTERTEALQISNKQLMQSNEELARFAYVASHDLREPLRNISNFTQLLKKNIISPNQSETSTYIDIIQQNTLHMNNLILDTLEYTNLSKVDNELIKINLNQTLEAVKAVLASTIKEKNASIQVITPLPILRSIKGLPFSLFKNIIENGIKYNESPEPLIQINYTLKEKMHLFSITDNGIGIPSIFQKDIFKMFKRLQNRDKYQGSGMGLANCKKIVNKLGGQIWVESDEQNGSTFFISLPTTNQSIINLKNINPSQQSITISK